MPILDPPLVLISPLFVILLAFPVALIPSELLTVVLMLPVDVTSRESPPFSWGTVGPWVTNLAVSIVASVARLDEGV